MGLFGFQWFGDKFLADVENRVDAGLNRAGQSVVARAQALAPKRTGALSSSISYQVTGAGGGAKLTLSGFTTTGKTLTFTVGVPYGIFQEFGTRNIRPHPYLRPALNEVGKIFGAELGMEFNIPFIASPLYAHQAGFALPPGLTGRQRKHIAKHLGPTSKRHYRGNVRKAKLRVRRAT